MSLCSYWAYQCFLLNAIQKLETYFWQPVFFSQTHPECCPLCLLVQEICISFHPEIKIRQAISTPVLLSRTSWVKIFILLTLNSLCMKSLSVSISQLMLEINRQTETDRQIYKAQRPFSSMYSKGHMTTMQEVVTGERVHPQLSPKH